MIIRMYVYTYICAIFFRVCLKIKQMHTPSHNCICAHIHMHINAPLTPFPVSHASRPAFHTNTHKYTYMHIHTYIHTYMQVMLLPVNFLPLMLADLHSIRLLGALGLAAGSLQLYLTNRIRKFGLQFV